jgi:4-hydroxythreonine-4-phosphate dehydrogenase
VSSPLRIAITTGDADGIGTEVAAKALAKLRPKAEVSFYLWRSARCPKSHLILIDRSFKRVTVNSWPEALKVPLDSPKILVDINSNLPPPMWVEITAKASFFGHIDAMATAPLSKTAIAAAGMKDIGHTDILKRVTQSKNLFMAFVGDKFNVVLASGHLAIQDVPKNLTSERLELAIRAAAELKVLLPKSFSAKPIAVLGLNPHAGEEGMIGKEEQEIHIPIIAKLAKAGTKVDGPLVPDAAFFPVNWKKYSVFVASYHDQGLIPFKMIHGQESGVHITMGLPFVRTSVDHGTAKDLFGKNKADASSMRLAIEWAIRLGRSTKNSKTKGESL